MKRFIALSLILSMVTTNLTMAHATSKPQNNQQTNNQHTNRQEEFQEFQELKEHVLSDITNRKNQNNTKGDLKNPLEKFDRERIIYPEQELPELEPYPTTTSFNIETPETQFDEYEVEDTRNFRVLTSNNSTYTTSSGTLMAQNANVNVWLIDSGSAIKVTDEMYDNILSQGQQIYDSMTTDIAPHTKQELPPIWSTIENVGDVDGDGRINILLYDINKDGNTNDSYVAGFFTASDMTSSNGNTPIDAFHMDIGTKQGGAYLVAEDYTSFFGTFAHEFQHMLFYSYLGWKINGYESLWINESLSGFTDMYYGGGTYSKNQIPDAGKFAYGVQNEYTGGLASDLAYGDFFNFNNSFKSYGVGYFFSAFMHEVFGNDYIKTMYEYFDKVELSYEKNDTFTLSVDGDDVYTSNYAKLYEQDEDYINQAIFGGAFSNVIAEKAGELTDEEALNYVYRLFMEAFIADGGTSEVNGEVVNYPTLWNGEDLWNYRVDAITETIKNNDTLTLEGYNSSVDEEATHEMVYKIDRINTLDEIFTITVGDDDTDDSLYVYIALLNEENDSKYADIVQLTLGEETEIDTEGRETYLFATTLYNDVDDVTVKLSWEEYVEPEVEKSVYDVSYNLTNITYKGDDTAIEGENYSTILTPASGYELPETVVIKMDSTQLSLNSNYIYDTTTGELTIANASSDITITAQASEIDERVKLQTPTIMGKPQVGEELTVAVNNISLSDFAIQWYANGEAIAGAGAKSTTFEVGTAQKGTTITVGVTPNEDSKDYLAIESISAKTDEVYEIYTITFIDGEKTDDVETTSTGKLSITSLPSATTITGETFIGWYDEDDTKITIYTIFDKDVTVTAKYIDVIDLTDLKETLQGGTVSGSSIDVSSFEELVIENAEDLGSLFITKVESARETIVTLAAEIGDIIWTIPVGAKIDPNNLLNLGITFGKAGTSSITDDDLDDSFTTIINFAHSGNLLLDGSGVTLQIPLAGVVTTDSIVFYKLDGSYDIMNGVDPVVGKVVEDGKVEAVFTNCSSWGAIVTSAIVDTSGSVDNSVVSTTTSTSSNSSSSSTYSPVISYEMYNIPTLTGMYISTLNNVMLNQLVNLNSIDMSTMEQYKGTFLGWYYDSDFTNPVAVEDYKLFVITQSIVDNGLYPLFANDTIYNDVLVETVLPSDEVSYTIIDNSTYTPAGVPTISTAVPNTNTK